MATLKEMAAQLPNGFHDTLISACAVDFVARTVEFDVRVWTGDMDSSQESEREQYRAGRLVIAGLAFCQFEAPDPRYPFADRRPISVDLCEPEASHPITSTLPANVFSGRFFVSTWNSFIHLAGEHATLDWIDGEIASDAG
jgi:hypothetical protein